MGSIRQEVYDNSKLTQKDLDIAKIFCSGFDVNYGDVINIANTTVTAFILKPEEYISDGFGLEKETLLIISYFDSIESRTIQAAEKVLEKYPYKNRVDNLCYFLVSNDQNIEIWMKEYYDMSINSKIIFPFSVIELMDSKNNQWFIRERLRKYSFDKDLFGYTLPLQDDRSFFGRQQILGRYIDAIKRCQNRGIFGLRKTGKTSLLFKIKRTIEEQHLGQVLFFDCKHPKIQTQRWFILLNSISQSIASRLGIKNFLTEDNPEKSMSSFQYIMTIASKRNIKIILIFDEIEYISYFSKQNKHWKDDYFEFWQTLWSEQSTFANLCFIICGVNAYVTEKDSINGIQNPLFGIIQSEYLVGLSLEETSQMIKTLGRRMGLKFEYDCIQFLYEQYGGHPLLTRMACSWINRYLTTESRPLILSKQRVQEMQKGFDSDPAFYSYFGHIISEIREFYPDEYEMLELLAAGQISDFIELSSVNEFVQHLNSYGLISWEKGIPSISLPVAGRYIAIELAKKEGRKSIYKLIDKNERSKWLTVRINIIIESMRSLEANIRSCKKDELYGVNSFPEAEKLNTVPVAVDNQTFSTFINVFYRCFVESINNYGKTIQKDHYLDNVIKSSYPLLFKTFDKIKEYRNEQDHLLLTSYHKQKLDEYLSEDLENSLETPDKYFCLQQKIVIELITNIYGESMGLE